MPDCVYSRGVIDQPGLSGPAGFRRAAMGAFYALIVLPSSPTGQQQYLTLVSLSTGCWCTGCVCSRDTLLGFAGLCGHMCCLGFACQGRGLPASVGMTSFLRQPYPGGADAQGTGGGAWALSGSKAFFLGQGRDWGGASVP